MYCSKCYDERKYTRLELATWQDKIPMIVGIEEIIKLIEIDITNDETVTNIPDTENIPNDWDVDHKYCLCEKESQSKINSSRPSTAQCEPLDLSRSNSTPTNDNNCNVDIPISRKSIVSNSNYSERELISAVRAICCGRIGTRRAAALYGIPRSTLRNRIFKVYDAKKIHEGDESMSMVDFFKKILKDDSMFSNVFQQKYQRENKEDKKKIIINEKEISIKNSSNRSKDHHVSNKELFKTELNELMKHHIKNDVSNDPDISNEDFPMDPFNFATNIPDIFNNYFPQSNHFQNLMTSYLYMMCQQNILSSVYGSLGTPNWQLPNFNVESFPLPQTLINLNSDSLDVKTVNNKENDIKFEKLSSNEVSTTNITQKSSNVANLLNDVTEDSLLQSGIIDSIFLNSDDLKDETIAPLNSVKKIKNDFNIAVLSDETSESSRHKKRGHYRQYNTDMLNKAIEAVRFGEMSVHKAGNHFGVPHSTLEYRVKQITDGISDEKASNKRSNKKKKINNIEINKQNDTESKKTDSDGCNTTSSSLKSQM